MVDNLNIHSATDVLLFALAHPRWEFVFQPKYAAYLNLIESGFRRTVHGPPDSPALGLMNCRARPSS